MYCVAWIAGCVFFTDPPNVCYLPSVRASALRFGYGGAFTGELLFCTAVVFVFLFMAHKSKQEFSPSFGIANAGVTIAGVEALVRLAVESSR